MTITNRELLNITTDTSGDASVTSEGLVMGLVDMCDIVVPASGGIADAAVTISIVKSDGTAGPTILAVTGISASASYHPRAALSTTAGVALIFATNHPIVTEIPAAAGDKLKVVVSGGGSVLKAQVYVVIKGE